MAELASARDRFPEHPISPFPTSPPLASPALPASAAALRLTLPYAGQISAHVSVAGKVMSKSVDHVLSGRLAAFVGDLRNAPALST